MLALALFIHQLRRRFYRWDRERIEAHQLKRARRQVRFAVAHSPYFRRLFSGRDLSDVWNLPTTCKREMMAHLSEYNTAGLDRQELVDFCVEMEYSRQFDRLFRGRYTVGMSSGTSGAKTLVILSPREKRRYAAIVAARHGVPESVKAFRVLFILRVTSDAYEAINRFGIQLRYTDLMTPIEKMVETLNAMRANILAGQPSILRLLAREAELGHIQSRVETVISYAEVLELEVREHLERVFRCPVIQLYQCSEGFIASSCRAGRLHLNEDLVAVQPCAVDEKESVDGKPASRLVITDLERRTQPILRYELNDCVVLDSERCACGSAFRVVERVLGRHDDLFVLPRLEGGHRIVFSDYISRAVIRATEQLSEYQVIQRDYSEVLVRALPREGEPFEPLAEAIRVSLSQMFSSYGCVVPAIRIVEEPPQANPRSLKLIRIQRAFAPMDSPAPGLLG
jgi:putative adenylate-forming enzyme